MRESSPRRQQQQRILKRAKTMRLPQKGAMNITKNLGMLLLAIYLILVGIIALVHIAIPVLVTGVLALAAGILILIGK
jgi:Flp pilus assembly protein TadB